MASVVVLVGDLMFASRIAESLGGAGHEVAVASTADRARELAADADVLVLDLADPALGAIGLLKEPSVAGDVTGPRTLGFYPHVEPGVRDEAIAAGVDLAVPRSRMAREGAALVASLAPG